jgi:hypothetical protein
MKLKVLEILARLVTQSRRCRRNSDNCSSTSSTSSSSSCCCSSSRRSSSSCSSSSRSSSSRSTIEDVAVEVEVQVQGIWDPVQLGELGYRLGIAKAWLWYR